MRTTRSPFPMPMPMPGEFRLSCAPFTFSSVWMWNHNFLCNCKRQQLTAIPRVVIGGYASSAAIDISTTNIRWIILSSFPARLWSAGKRGEGGKGGFSLQFFLFLVFFSWLGLLHASQQVSASGYLISSRWPSPFVSVMQNMSV